MIFNVLCPCISKQCCHIFSISDLSEKHFKNTHPKVALEVCRIAMIGIENFYKFVQVLTIIYSVARTFISTPCLTGLMNFLHFLLNFEYNSL